VCAFGGFFFRRQVRKGTLQQPQKSKPTSFSFSSFAWLISVLFYPPCERTTHNTTTAATILLWWWWQKGFDRKATSQKSHDRLHSVASSGFQVFFLSLCRCVGPSCPSQEIEFWEEDGAFLVDTGSSGRALALRREEDVGVGGAGGKNDSSLG
jgi:hypothetical protein